MPAKKKPQPNAAVEAAPAPTVIHAIKGFDANLQCRGFQFAVGETYTHQGRVKACEGGFHAVSGHPLAVFKYYAPAGSRFCRVELSGAVDGDDGEKTAAAILKVGQEIGLSDLVQEAVDWVTARATPEGEAATGNQGAASASGTRGAATASGYQGAATASGTQGAASASGTQGAATASGEQGAASATGSQGAASATGYQGAASATGTRGAASATGEQGAATASGTQGAASATGYQGAASATGYQGAASATGYQGAASATGDQGAASATGSQGAASATGYQGAASATGTRGAAMTSGYGGRVSGAIGNALFAVERPTWNGPIVSVACGIVGQGGVKPDTWYRAVGGKLVEAA